MVGNNLFIHLILYLDIELGYDICGIYIFPIFSILFILIYLFLKYIYIFYYFYIYKLIYIYKYLNNKN
jgi:hypothetical protein